MGAPVKFTYEQIASALKQANGAPTVAARLLGCSYMTVRRAMEKSKEVKEARNESHDSLLDRAELTLASMALGATDDKGAYIRTPNIAALIFLLKTQGKERGYVERVELYHKFESQLSELDSLAKDRSLSLEELLNELIRQLRIRPIDSGLASGAIHPDDSTPDDLD